MVVHADDAVQLRKLFVLDIKQCDCALPMLQVLLNKKFQGEKPEVTEQFLRQVGFVPQRFRGKVKIVGDGVVDVPITIRGVALSKSAREKILKAGGAVV